jgi:FHS family Na+ dependent glucose MFS transporter 1
LVVGISIAYFVAFFGVGLVIASLGPIMIALSVQTSAAVDDLAFLFTSRAVGYLLGSVVSGALVDKLPGHRLMCAGLAANSVATGVFPFTGSIPLLAALSSVQGLAMGVLDTGIMALLPLLYIPLLPLLTIPTVSDQRAPALAARQSQRPLDASDGKPIRSRRDSVTV